MVFLEISQNSQEATVSSNINEVIRAVLNSLFFYKQILHTHTHTHTRTHARTHKVLTSYVSLVHIYKRIV